MIGSRAAAEPVADTTTPASTLRARLLPAMPGSEFWGWAGPILVTLFGAFLRFNNLGTPKAVIFDETYYVPDAFGILRFGVEHNYSAGRNALLVRGDPHIFTHGGEFVVHPPLGKLFIAFGEWTFGLNSFGWRFSTALIGTLAILLLARITRRMTRSTLLGCVAGPADGAGRARVRDEPDRAAGHLPDVLGAGRVRLPGGGPRPDPGPAGRGGRGVAGRVHCPPGLGHPVADRRRGVHRAGPGLQVGRDLVRARAGRPGHRVGLRRTPGRRACAAGCPRC